MKKLLLMTLAIGILSCSSNEENNNLNCDCDRVVEASTFNVVGTPENPATMYYTVYTTINDCTQIQKQKSYTSAIYEDRPQLNQCR
mgnify:CR=1 FL=1